MAKCAAREKEEDRRGSMECQKRDRGCDGDDDSDKQRDDRGHKMKRPRCGRYLADTMVLSSPGKRAVHKLVA